MNSQRAPSITPQPAHHRRPEQRQQSQSTPELPTFSDFSPQQTLRQPLASHVAESSENNSLIQNSVGMKGEYYATNSNHETQLWHDTLQHTHIEAANKQDLGLTKAGPSTRTPIRARESSFASMLGKASSGEDFYCSSAYSGATAVFTDEEKQVLSDIRWEEQEHATDGSRGKRVVEACPLDSFISGSDDSSKPMRFPYSDNFRGMLPPRLKGGKYSENDETDFLSFVNNDCREKDVNLDFHTVSDGITNNSVIASEPRSADSNFAVLNNPMSRHGMEGRFASPSRDTRSNLPIASDPGIKPTACLHGTPGMLVNQKHFVGSSWRGGPNASASVLEQQTDPNRIIGSIEQSLRQRYEEQTGQREQTQRAPAVLSKQENVHIASHQRNEAVILSLDGAQDALVNQEKPVTNSISCKTTYSVHHSKDAVGHVELPSNVSSNHHMQGKNKVFATKQGLGTNQEKKRQSRGGGSRRISSTFPHQLMDILSSRHSQQTISWLPDGNGFAIFDRAALVSDVLPSYYLKEVKLASFIRKLNRWGFQRTKSDIKDSIVYRHKLFKRDRPDLCSQMKIKDCSNVAREPFLRNSKRNSLADSPPPPT